MVSEYGDYRKGLPVKAVLEKLEKNSSRVLCPHRAWAPTVLALATVLMKAYRGMTSSPSGLEGSPT